MRFSIIMPVLNEKVVLEQQLAYLSRQYAHHDCELLIVDGGSTDRTVPIAEQYGYVISSPRGRATQMNAGAAAASGDVFIFLHADTQLPDDAFDAIERTFQSPQIVAGAFRICFNCDRWPYRLVAFSTNLTCGHASVPCSQEIKPTSFVLRAFELSEGILSSH